MAKGSGWEGRRSVPSTLPGSSECPYMNSARVNVATANLSVASRTWLFILYLHFPSPLVTSGNCYDQQVWTNRSNKRAQGQKSIWKMKLQMRVSERDRSLLRSASLMIHSCLFPLRRRPTRCRLCLGSHLWPYCSNIVLLPLSSCTLILNNCCQTFFLPLENV